MEKRSWIKIRYPKVVNKCDLFWCYDIGENEFVVGEETKSFLKLLINGKQLEINWLQVLDMQFEFSSKRLHKNGVE